MKKVIVYLKADYSINEEFNCPIDWTKNQITEEVNKRFKEWYYYDII